MKLPRLNWRIGLALLGALGVAAAAAALARRSGPGCGEPVFGRWSIPYFVFVIAVAVSGEALLVLAVLSGEERARRTGQGLVVAGLAVALTLGALSLVMRFTRPPYVRRPPLYTNHQTLGYFFSPNMRYESNAVADEYRAVFFTDRNGLVIRDGSNDPRPGAWQIMFLGDSMLRGIEVAADANLSVLTARTLAAATGHDVQSINLGVSGYSPTRYLLAYRAFLETYDPQTVVVLIYAGNDFTEDARLALDDQVIDDDAGQPVAIRPQKDYQRGLMWTNEVGMIPFEEARPRLVSESAWKGGVVGVTRELLIWPLCKRLDLAAFDPATYDPAGLSLEPFNDGESLPCRDTSGDLTALCLNYAIRDHSLIRNNDYAIFKDAYTGMDEADTAYALDALSLLAGEVAADGRDLLVLVIPLSTQVPNQGEGLKPQRGLRPGQVIDSTAPQDVWRDFCAAHGLDCIDLLPLFLEHSDEQIYWVYDTHLTPRGHELIAEAIAAHLLAAR